MIRLGRRAAWGGMMATSVAGAARGAGWPDKTVTWILPFSAGGAADVFARPVAAQAGATLGQSIVNDNRTGAGGTLAAAIVARAPADGYTMLVGYTGHTYAPLIYPKAQFDLARDFAPICALGRVPQALVVNPEKIDAGTLQQFIELAKRKPGSINFASAGLGTVPHLALELLQTRAGIRVHHVPYRGSGPALQDLLGGQVEAMFGPVAAIMGQVKTGKLRVLGIAGRRREPQLPDVPTMDESGLKDFRAIAWYALFAPKKTPDAALDRMHAAVQQALATDEVKAIWLQQGAKVELESRAEFTRFVDQEIVRWGGIAKAANIQLE
jgi:tripartite-type tricarboxylate transporter receptor subunit TctC